MEEKIFGCDLSIAEHTKEFEKLGYSHEDAVELAKSAVKFADTTYNFDDLDYATKGLIEKFCELPLVNPISTNDLRKILGEQNELDENIRE